MTDIQPEPATPLKEKHIQSIPGPIMFTVNRVLFVVIGWQNPGSGVA